MLPLEFQTAALLRPLLFPPEFKQQLIPFVFHTVLQLWLTKALKKKKKNMKLLLLGIPQWLLNKFGSAAVCDSAWIEWIGSSCAKVMPAIFRHNFWRSKLGNVSLYASACWPAPLILHAPSDPRWQRKKMEIKKFLVFLSASSHSSGIKIGDLLPV